MWPETFRSIPSLFSLFIFFRIFSQGQHNLVNGKREFVAVIYFKRFGCSRRLAREIQFVFCWKDKYVVINFVLFPGRCLVNDSVLGSCIYHESDTKSAEFFSLLGWRQSVEVSGV